MVRLTPFPTPLARVCLKTHAPFNPLRSPVDIVKFTRARSLSLSLCFLPVDGEIHAHGHRDFFFYLFVRVSLKHTRVTVHFFDYLTQCSCSFLSCCNFCVVLVLPMQLWLPFVRATNALVVVCSPKHR
jgi:hypothetical protein